MGRMERLRKKKKQQQRDTNQSGEIVSEMEKPVMPDCGKYSAALPPLSFPDQGYSSRSKVGVSRRTVSEQGLTKVPDSFLTPTQSAEDIKVIMARKRRKCYMWYGRLGAPTKTR